MEEVRRFRQEQGAERVAAGKRWDLQCHRLPRDLPLPGRAADAVTRRSRRSRRRRAGTRVASSPGCGSWGTLLSLTSTSEAREKSPRKILALACRANTRRGLISDETGQVARIGQRLSHHRGVGFARPLTARGHRSALRSPPGGGGRRHPCSIGDPRAPSPGAVARMRVFNPDGGEPEMCGNGIRIFARYLARLGAVRPEPPSSSWRRWRGRSSPVILADGTVRVDMGRARFVSANIDLSAAGRRVGRPRPVGSRPARTSSMPLSRPAAAATGSPSSTWAIPTASSSWTIPRSSTWPA